MLIWSIVFPVRNSAGRLNAIDAMTRQYIEQGVDPWAAATVSYLQLRVPIVPSVVVHSFEAIDARSLQAADLGRNLTGWQRAGRVGLIALDLVPFIPGAGKLVSLVLRPFLMAGRSLAAFTGRLASGSAQGIRQISALVAQSRPGVAFGASARDLTARFLARMSPELRAAVTPFLKAVRLYINCFPANTPVSTEHGLRPIKDIRQDDQVWAFDLISGEWKLRRVLETYEHEHEGRLLAFTVAGEIIESTEGHPWWVVEGQELYSRPQPEHVPDAPQNSKIPGRWVDAGELRLGDVLLLHSGRLAPITAITERQAKEKVYNFHVEDLQCYAVGKNQILVHNNSAEIARLEGEIARLRASLGGPGVDAVATNLEIAALRAQITALQVTIIPTFASNFGSKIKSKLNQLRKKYPEVRSANAGGIDDALRIAQARVAQGGGRVGPPIGQGFAYAIYFEDGPVTWIFRPNGSFWSMFTNSGWIP